MGAPSPATLPGQTAHSSGYRIGPAGLLVLDMRSERRPRGGELSASGGQLRAEQVVSEASWRAIYRWLDAQANAGDMKHLFVMNSIPLLGACESGTRVTLLSGDVHVAAAGVIESDRADVPTKARVINQLTSGGIVHPPPPGAVLYFLEQACQMVETIDRGISGAM